METHHVFLKTLWNISVGDILNCAVMLSDVLACEAAHVNLPNPTQVSWRHCFLKDCASGAMAF